MACIPAVVVTHVVGQGNRPAHGFPPTPSPPCPDSPTTFLIPHSVSFSLSLPLSASLSHPLPRSLCLPASRSPTLDPDHTILRCSTATWRRQYIMAGNSPDCNARSDGPDIMQVPIHAEPRRGRGWGFHPLHLLSHAVQAPTLPFPGTQNRDVVSWKPLTRGRHVRYSTDKGGETISEIALALTPCSSQRR